MSLQEVDEHPQLQRRVFAGRPHQPVDAGLGTVLKDLDQLPALQPFADGEVRQVGDADPLHGEHDARFQIVADHRGGQLQIDVLGFAGQWPDLQLAGVGEAKLNTAVPYQVDGRLGYTVFFEIVRRAHQDHLIRADMAGGQAGVGDFAAANHRVVAFFDDIDPAIVEGQVQVDGRIGFLELGQDRQKGL